MCSVRCVFSKCESRTSIQCCLCVVSKESVVIDVDGGIFLSRCLIVALPRRH